LKVGPKGDNHYELIGKDESERCELCIAVFDDQFIDEQGCGPCPVRSYYSKPCTKLEWFIDSYRTNAFSTYEEAITYRDRVVKILRNISKKYR
jgi:hypothetical protein